MKISFPEKCLHSFFYSLSKTFPKIGGNKRQKFLQQLLAASETGCDWLDYRPFDDQSGLERDINKFMNCVAKCEPTVGKVYEIMSSLWEKIKEENSFDCIINEIQSATK